MKTVPYLYKTKERSAKINPLNSDDKSAFPKEINGHLVDFTHLINQNSPFRFMKIHTNLMESEGIFKNDIVVIDPRGIPVTGKIVVINLDDTFLIRRYEKLKNGFLLHVDGQKISPLQIESGYERMQMIGIVIFTIKSV